MAVNPEITNKSMLKEIGTDEQLQRPITVEQGEETDAEWYHYSKEEGKTS